MNKTPSVRVAIVSDTHGFLDPRVADVAADCDLVVHAGDIGCSSVLDTLATRAEVHAIVGNNDVPEKWSADGHARLAGLAEALTLELPGGRLAVEHGHRIHDTRRYHQRLRERHPGARVVIYGHTHVQVTDQSSRPWVVNPGAAGRVRTKKGPSCAVLSAGARRWHVREYRFVPLGRAAA